LNKVTVKQHGMKIISDLTGIEDRHSNTTSTPHNHDPRLTK